RRGGGDRGRQRSGRIDQSGEAVSYADPVARAHAEFGYHRYQTPAEYDAAKAEARAELYELEADVAETAPVAEAVESEAEEIPSAHETSIDAVSDPATASGQVLPAEGEVTDAPPVSDDQPVVGETTLTDGQMADPPEAHDEEDDEEEAAEEEQVES